ncbi:MAG TPA: MarR family transcriptional regulator [Bryobacteraceae bacterium]|nr:MarR family transcriptional regulator [Bryobacteraceae bacterium]
MTEPRPSVSGPEVAALMTGPKDGLASAISLVRSAGRAAIIYDAPLDNSRYNEYYRIVAGKLAREIRQTKPFASVEEEALLNLSRTAEALHQKTSEVLKPFDISATQYNVLRILRGAGDAGLPCSQIGERMVTADPDITRLLDRLEKRGLIERERSTEDRRMVITRIARQGLDFLAGTDTAIQQSLKKNLGHLGKAKLQQLIDLLEELRGDENT